MKKIATLAAATLLLSSLSIAPALAFTDVDDSQREAIISLKERGIVNGVDGQHFAPKGTVTFAQSLQMIVNGLELTLDDTDSSQVRPASEIFTNIADDAWYAKAFVIAHYNGLEIAADVDPNANVTREQFANLLVHALETKGDYALIEIFLIINDGDQIQEEYQGALQRLLLYKIAELDKKGNFYPKQTLSRGEAASWVYNAIKVVESFKEHEAPVEAEDIEVTIEKVNDDVNKVILSRGEKPTSGYDITITGIRFEQDGKAVITYALTDPAADSINLTVITHPKAETFVSSQYEIVTEAAFVSGSSGSVDPSEPVSSIPGAGTSGSYGQ